MVQRLWHYPRLKDYDFLLESPSPRRVANQGYRVSSTLAPVSKKLHTSENVFAVGLNTRLIRHLGGISSPQGSTTLTRCSSDLRNFPNHWHFLGQQYEGCTTYYHRNSSHIHNSISWTDFIASLFNPKCDYFDVGCWNLLCMYFLSNNTLECCLIIFSTKN